MYYEPIVYAIRSPFTYIMTKNALKNNQNREIVLRNCLVKIKSKNGLPLMSQF